MKVILFLPNSIINMFIKDLLRARHLIEASLKNGQNLGKIDLTAQKLRPIHSALL